MAKRKSRKDYEAMTVEELRAEAAKENVEGRSAMHRDELVAALSGDGPAGGDGGAETPSNTTSGGKDPKAEGGVAVYPPSPSDQSGEKTDNVPPAKKLPPDAPDAGADEVTLLRAQNAALARVVANLGGNPAEVVRQATAGMELKKAKKPAGPARTAKVNGTEVEYYGDAGDDAAAKAAYRAQAGIWHTPTEPTVEHHK